MPHPAAQPVSDTARGHELRWSLLGPDLLAEPELPLFHWPATHRQAVDEMVAPPEPMARRLGRRFEQHWQHGLSQWARASVLGTGIQVRAAGRTIGELDLLMQHAGVVWHLELAVKFYRCIRGRSGDAWSDWIGPGGRDRLDLKLHRMRTHQVPLGTTEPARAELDRLGLPHPTRSAAVLRGLRFADWRAPRSDAAGRWCRAAELEDALPTARLLTRSAWLGAGPGTPADWRDGAALTAAVMQTLVHGAVQAIDPTGCRWLIVP